MEGNVSGYERDLGSCAKRCFGKSSHEISATDITRGCLEPNPCQLFGSSTDSIQKEFIKDQVLQSKVGDELGQRTAQGDDTGSIESQKISGGESVGPRVSEHPWIAKTSDEGEAIRTTIAASELVRKLNSSPFGEVINDRLIRRHRHAFPDIDAGRGKVHLLVYMAMLCSRRRRGVRSGRRGDTLSLPELQELLEKQNYRCALTGERLKPEDTALDHIVPISEGGSFSFENSQLVTKSANRAKNTMPEDEFISMCHQIASTRSRPGASQSNP